MNSFTLVLEYMNLKFVKDIKKKILSGENIFNLNSLIYDPIIKKI